jgi:hypothetical protein
MSNQIDPNFKEGMLTILIVMPFIILLSLSHIDKEDVIAVFISDAIAYAIMRITYKQKTGRWKW